MYSRALATLLLRLLAAVAAEQGCRRKRTGKRGEPEPNYPGARKGALVELEVRESSIRPTWALPTWPGALLQAKGAVGGPAVGRLLGRRGPEVPR